MMTLLKRARLNYFKDKGFAKYLLYAVGEIILVVTGILIALNVNNWNNQEKLSEQSMNQLLAVQNELLENLELAKTIILESEDKDASCNMVLSDTLEYEDYSSGGSWKMRGLLWNVSQFNPVKGSFEIFSSNRENHDESFDPILEKLNYLYTSHYDNIMLTNEALINSYEEERQNLQRNHEWYWKVMNSPGFFDKDHIEYMLTDPFYKNKVSYMSQMVRSMYGYSNQFKLIAEQAIRDIDKITNQPERESTALYQVEARSSDLYLGEFEHEGDDKCWIVMKKDSSYHFVFRSDTFAIQFENSTNFYHFDYPEIFFEYKFSENLSKLTYMRATRETYTFDRVK